MTPYSALASGRLSRRPGETSLRLEKDAYAKFKYDKTAEADGLIIDRVLEIAEKKGVSMTEVSLAWLLTKVTSPIVGATKLSHVDGAVKAVDLKLTDDEIALWNVLTLHKVPMHWDHRPRCFSFRFCCDLQCISRSHSTALPKQ